VSRLLALDISFSTGWACSDGGSGVMNFPNDAKATVDPRYYLFHHWVRDLVNDIEPDVIYIEKPNARYYYAACALFGMRGILYSVAAINNCRIEEVSPSSIKIYATGKGNAKKIDMVNALAVKYPDLVIINDDHADAIHMMDLGTDLELTKERLTALNGEV
jgi:Holliday junction resolvasome RuvABC endonuclease subunit